MGKSDHALKGQKMYIQNLFGPIPPSCAEKKNGLGMKPLEIRAAVFIRHSANTEMASVTVMCVPPGTYSPKHTSLVISIPRTDITRVRGFPLQNINDLCFYLQSLATPV